MDDSLKDFFNDREIFVTGGSGFLGKGIIEKILRSFNVRKIFVLLREKKGIEPNKRLEQLKEDQIFEVLHKEKPNEFNKVVLIPGDVSQLNLALSNDKIELLQNVSIVLHSAATIRFDEPLKTAILINVRGTREVLRIAEKLPKLQIFLHISTLFSNCNLKFIDEKIYTAPVDWKNCIRIAEEVNDEEMAILSKKFIKGFPNTYTFTKFLSEHVVNDFHKTIPTIIIRPSIVLCALFDPVPGYTDNVSGSTSVAVAGGTGLLRTFLCDPEMTPNQISLDVVTRIAILSIWKAASDKKEKIPFICNISGEIYPEFSIRRQLEILETIWREIPYDKMFWKPSVYPTNCPKIYFIRLTSISICVSPSYDSLDSSLYLVAPLLDGNYRCCFLILIEIQLITPFVFVLTQLIPAAIGDVGLRLLGKQPVLVKYQRIIINAIRGFQFFLSSPIVSGFSNMKMLTVESKKFPGFEARETFTLDAMEYGKIVAKSCRQFIFKEKDSDIPKARKHYKWFLLADILLKIFFIFLFLIIIFYWLT